MLHKPDEVATEMNRLPSELYCRFLTNKIPETAKTKVWRIFGLELEMNQVISSNDVTAEEAEDSLADSLAKNYLLPTLFCRLILEDPIVVLHNLQLSPLKEWHFYSSWDIEYTVGQKVNTTLIEFSEASHRPSTNIDLDISGPHRNQKAHAF